MNTRVFLITAKTNLHVGDEGGAEFSIIDKAVQRDPLTGLPCIHSSSLKGALNEFCTGRLDADKRIRLFGSDKKKEKADTRKGEAVFFDAHLLLLPKQEDNRPYSLVTANEVLARMKERIELLGEEVDLSALPAHGVEAYDKFKEACSDDNLPIIARNVLDDGGISKNIWYEQVLPAETVLYAVIQEKGDDLKNALDGKVVQIGANASIGYGYCKIKFL